MATFLSMTIALFIMFAVAGALGLWGNFGSWFIGLWIIIHMQMIGNRFRVY